MSSRSAASARDTLLASKQSQIMDSLTEDMCGNNLCCQHHPSSTVTVLTHLSS